MAIRESSADLAERLDVDEQQLLDEAEKRELGEVVFTPAEVELLEEVFDGDGDDDDDDDGDGDDEDAESGSEEE